MESLKLNKDSSGRYDVVIEGSDLAMVDGIDDLKQVLVGVLSTNKGEWEYDKEEGIDFHKILVKNPNYELIEDEIRQAIKRIDEELEVSNIKYEQKENRRVDIQLEISNGEKFEISIESA